LPRWHSEDEGSILLDIVRYLFYYQAAWNAALPTTHIVYAAMLTLRLLLLTFFKNAGPSGWVPCPSKVTNRDKT
jgi:hypothetical protein